MGPCAGGDVYSPALTDFVFMVANTGHMFVTGPEVVKTVTNEAVSARGARRRAGPRAETRHCDRAYDNDFEALVQMRRLHRFPARLQHGRPA